jgi:hypothetical protein
MADHPPSGPLGDRIADLLPTLNLLVLVIPIVATAMQLSSSAASFATEAVRPADVAKLETPALRRERAWTSPEQPRSPSPSPAVEPTAPAPEPARPVDSGFSVRDPLLGYGL